MYHCCQLKKKLAIFLFDFLEYSYHWIDDEDDDAPINSDLQKANGKDKCNLKERKIYLLSLLPSSSLSLFFFIIIIISAFNIDPLQKWRPLNYSFVHIQNRCCNSINALIFENF